MRDGSAIEFRDQQHCLQFSLGPAADRDAVQTVVSVVAGELQGQFTTRTWWLDWLDCRKVLESLYARDATSGATSFHKDPSPEIRLAFERTPSGPLGVEVDISTLFETGVQ